MKKMYSYRYYLIISSILLFTVIAFKLPAIFCSDTHNKTPKKGIDIQRALEYPIPEIIERYKRDYAVSDEVAKLHEQELKRYLILVAENYPKDIPMFSKEVDNLWHTFLLFTKDYQKYCEEMLGAFIHHVPKTHEV